MSSSRPAAISAWPSRASAISRASTSASYSASGTRISVSPPGVMIFCAWLPINACSRTDPHHVEHGAPVIHDDTPVTYPEADLGFALQRLDVVRQAGRIADILLHLLADTRRVIGRHPHQRVASRFGVGDLPHTGQIS